MIENVEIHIKGYYYQKLKAKNIGKMDNILEVVLPDASFYPTLLFAIRSRKYELNIIYRDCEYIIKHRKSLSVFGNKLLISLDEKE